MTVSAGAIRAGRAFVELGVKDSKFKKGMTDAEKRMNAFASGVAKIGAASLAMGTAVAGGLAAMSRAFANAADDLDTLATQSGMSVEALSELSLGVKQANLSMEDLSGGVARMQRVIAAATQGNSGAIGALDAIGLSVGQLASMSPEDQLGAIADGIASIADPAQRTAAAMNIFGRGGAALIPLLANGSKGLAEMRSRARELGLTMSTTSARAGAQLADRLDELSAVTARATQRIGEAFAPALKVVVERASEVIAGFGKFVSQNPQVVMAVGKVAVGMAGLGAALITVALAVKGLALAIGFVLTPLGAVAAGLVAVGAAAVAFSGGPSAVLKAAGENVAEAWQSAKGVLDSLTLALQNGDLATAGEIAAAALQIAFLKAANTITTAFQSLFGWMARSLASILASATSGVAAAIAPDAGGSTVIGKYLKAGAATGLAAYSYIAGLVDPTIKSASSDAVMFGMYAARQVGSANSQYSSNYDAQELFRKQMVDGIGRDIEGLFDGTIDTLEESIKAATARMEEARAKAEADAFASWYEAGGANPFSSSPAVVASAANAMQAMEEVFANLGPGGSRGTFATSDAGLASLRGGVTAQLLERIAKVAERIERSVDDMEAGIVIPG